MALSIHVVAHRTTDAVLAACTRGEGGTQADLIAAIVGDALPLSYGQITQPGIGRLSSIDAGQLVIEKVPGDPVVEIGNVLDAPFDFVITRDAQGQVQSLDKALPMTATVAGTTVTVTFPTPIDSTGRPGLIRLVDATNTALDTTVTLRLASLTNLNVGTASVVAPPGTYKMLVLVKGFAARVEETVKVT